MKHARLTAAAGRGLHPSDLCEEIAKSRSLARQGRIVLAGMNIARWPGKSQKWVWGTLVALAGIGAVGVALWQVPWWLDAHYLPDITQPQATAVTGVRTALLAMGAGGLAAVGILYTHRTLHQNREGQVTDRYTKAISQIASDKPVEQLGGIYALERIMRDSAKDHATIVEVLAAFVREHATLAMTESSAQGRLRFARQHGHQRGPPGCYADVLPRTIRIHVCRNRSRRH
ncbi:hypothetical protein ABZ467_36775 [Streptomyces sp. NPDC005727]|uniref:hypothetical protein n=1 Tax=Streptomyces sp. NPDC005727 TaxID=3157053 RepID=UPI0033C3D162